MAVLNTDENLVLNINKPIGITSFDVIRQLKKRYPKNKIGHAGTLDPLADGVLICLVGISPFRYSSINLPGVATRISTPC